ncbi:MAG: hypothetical protein KF713_06720 [Turneriella sp.]|nr:hypothetical protein [Turneriella sp.]
MTRTKKTISICITAILIVACKKADELPKDGPITPMKEYTVENAREWTNIAKEHGPTAKASINKGFPAVLVEIPLVKADEGHYIEKIGIMDMAGNELAVETMPRQRNPLTYAYFDLKIIPWSGKVKIFAKCNKHDLWVKEVPVKDLGV